MSIRVNGRIPAAYATAATRERRARLKADEKCTICGENPPREGRNTCQECADYRSTKERKAA